MYMYDENNLEYDQEWLRMIEYRNTIKEGYEFYLHLLYDSVAQTDRMIKYIIDYIRIFNYLAGIN